MKRLRKSMKIILSLVAVAVVSVVAVVTVIVTNYQKNKSRNNTSVDTGYHLTAAQKAVANAVAQKNKNIISRNKTSAVAYDYAGANVEDIDYIGDTYFYTNDKTIFFFGDNNEIKSVFEILVEQNIIQAGYTTAVVNDIFDKHFDFFVEYSSGDAIIGLASIENNSVLIHKTFELERSGDNLLLDGNEFSYCNGNQFFAALIKTGTQYNFELFEYLSDYIGYESKKVPVDTEKLTEFYIDINTFVVKQTGLDDVRVFYYDGIGFSATQIISNSSLTELSGAKLVETRSDSDTSSAKAVKVSDKYRTFTYTLELSDSTQKNIDLGDYSKVSVADFGEDYFALFFQKVDENNALISAGRMVYLDYDLNVIAEYDAKSSQSIISLAFNESLLTREGFLSTKNNTKLTKLYDFSSNNYTLVSSIVDAQKIIVKNSLNKYLVLNLNLQKALDDAFDSHIFVNDTILILEKDSEFFMYNSVSNEISSIDFVDNDVNKELANRTNVFFVSQDSELAMYENGQETLNSISQANVEDNYMQITVNAVETDYILCGASSSGTELYAGTIKSENHEDAVENYANVNLLVNDGGGGSQTSTSLADDINHPFYEDKTWFDYTDKTIVMENNQTISGNDYDYTIKATHCIKSGISSKSDYIDFFEIHYAGENHNSNDYSTYVTLKIFYKVTIVNGNPQVAIMGIGHYDIGWRVATANDINGVGTKGLIQIGETTYRIASAGHSVLDLRDGTSPIGLDVDQTSPTKSYDLIDRNNGKPIYVYRITNEKIRMHTATTEGEGNFCKAEVYGDSIRVTLIFDYFSNDATNHTNKISSSNYSLTTAGNGKKYYMSDKCKFLSLEMDDRIDESITTSTPYAHFVKIVDHSTDAVNYDYYEKLFYQTVVLSVKNSNINYFDNIIDTGTFQPIDDDFYDVIEQAVESDNGEHDYLEQLVSQNGVGTIYYACISNKIYLDRENQTELLLGTNIQQEIVGAKLVGVTSINETDYKNIKHSNLYDITARTYQDSMVSFRVDNKTNLLFNSSAIQQREENGLTMSFFEYDNPRCLYYEGGLNRFRYVYSIYEPRDLYVQLDYHISTSGAGDTTSLENEIDYLRYYSSVGVGISGESDYTTFEKNWVYANYTNANSSDSNSFFNEGNIYTTDAHGNKIPNPNRYVPYNFNDNTTRNDYFDIYTDATGDNFSVEFNALGGSNKKEAELRRRENAAVIHEYKDGNKRYFYITIEGVNYYLQENYLNGTTAYADPFSDFDSLDPDGSGPLMSGKYFCVFKNLSDLESNSITSSINGISKATKTDKNFGYLYTSGGNYNCYYNNLNANYREYSAGISAFFVRVALVGLTWTAYYHAENIHTRDSQYYGYYAYDGSGNLSYGAPSPYLVKETFKFLWTDNFVLLTVPYHTHYEFVGWKVTYGDYNGMLLKWVSTAGNNENSWEVGHWQIVQTDYLGNETVLIDNIGTSTSFNVLSISDVYNFLAGKGANYYAEWFEGSTWQGTLTKPINLVAQWKPVKCEVKATLYTINGNDITYIDASDATNPYGKDGKTQSVSNLNNIIFKKNGTDIDTRKRNADGSWTNNSKDGVLDVYLQFDYNLNITFAQIGEIFASQGYTSSNIIKSSDVNFQFMGWAFLPIDADKYCSITSTTAGDTANTTKIQRYVDLNTETVTIEVRAYFSTSKYNFDLNVHPIGGATTQAAGKDYYSNNDNIYNNDRNPSAYKIEVTDTNLNPDPDTRRYTNSDSVIALGYLKLGYDDTKNSYYTHVQEKFFAGSNVRVKTTINKEYYLKRIEFNNLILCYTYSSGNPILDAFKIVIEYNYSSQKWLAVGGQAVSENSSTRTLSVITDNDGTFHFENLSDARVKTYNDGHNKIKFEVVNDESGYSGVSITITTLSSPGTIENYNNQQITGENGFVMHFYSETIYHENESISVSKPFDVEEANKVLPNYIFMYASQPLTTIDGIAPTIKSQDQQGSTVYIWIGTTPYLFAQEYSNTIVPGYYRVFNDNRVPSLLDEYTFENFATQTETHQSQFGAVVDVYFDGNRVYYPIKTVRNGDSTNALQVNNNNTRAIIIEPKQSQTYASASPNSVDFLDQWEIENYLSQITLRDPNYSETNTIFSFYPITKTLNNASAADKLYSYGFMNLNLNTNDGNSRLTDRNNPSVPKTLRLFNETVTINDAYLLNITGKGTAGTATVTLNFYLYLTRNQQGKTRYVLFYDEISETIADGYVMTFMFENYSHNAQIQIVENDLYNSLQDDGDEYKNSNSVEIFYQDDNNNTPTPIFDDGTGGKTFAYNQTFLEDGTPLPVAAVGTNPSFYTQNNLMTKIKATGSDKWQVVGITWNSSFDYLATLNRRYLIKPNDGYLIKSIKVYVGNLAMPMLDDARVIAEKDERFNLLYSFVLDENSLFDDLRFFASNGNYTYTSIENNILSSFVRYNVSSYYGFDAINSQNYTTGYNNIYASSQNKFGCYYSAFYTLNWQTGDSATFNFDHIYLMFAGLYQDYKIEIETTTYADFIFEGSSDGTNILYKGSTTPSAETGKKYANINLSDAKLQVYRQVKDPSVLESNYIQEITDAKNSTSYYHETNLLYTDKTLFLLKYYVADPATNGVGKGTIRLIFLGTASYISGGLHIVATGTDYSVAFTNGRYYNETILDYHTHTESKVYDHVEYTNVEIADADSFRTLNLYSGRTILNGNIETTDTPVVDGDTLSYIRSRHKTNKLVYMFTGELFSNSGTGFFDFDLTISNPKRNPYLNVNERNSKYMFVVTAIENTIEIETSSYLYNDTLKTDESLNSYSYTQAEKLGSVYYNINADETKIYLKDSSSGAPSELYQLDNTSKSKSWFNDTILTNIALSYNFAETVNALDITKASFSGATTNWQQRDLTDNTISAISSVTATGYGFKWTYSEVPGYYLKYIAIYSPDIGKYLFIDLTADGNWNYGDGTYKNSFKNYTNRNVSLPINLYNFEWGIMYYTQGSDNSSKTGEFVLDFSASGYSNPALSNTNSPDLTTNHIKGASIMANNIKVMFLSKAYDYEISYKNYTLTDVSTSSSFAIQGSNKQTIYYDSMSTLKSYATMNGYTFIGWGTQYYLGWDNSTPKKATPTLRFSKSSDSFATWNTSSTWFDISSYFAYDNVTGLSNLRIDFFNNDNKTLPRYAYYVEGGYFITDTGIKGNVANQQNYNFWCNYVTEFAVTMGNYYQQNKSGLLTRSAGRYMDLYALFKVNVYTVKFNANIAGDKYYDYTVGTVALTNSTIKTTTTFATTLNFDRLGFENTNGTFTCYGIFDTRIWYISRGTDGGLKYSYKSPDSTNPYVIADMARSSSNQASFLIDRFGYTWLGWFYEHTSHVNNVSVYSSNKLLFSSPYSYIKYQTGSPLFKQNVMPLLNSDVLSGAESRSDSGIFETEKVHYLGQHKAIHELRCPNCGHLLEYHIEAEADKQYVCTANSSHKFSRDQVDIGLNTSDGYVYFYSYVGVNSNGSGGSSRQYAYHDVSDMINTYTTGAYSRNSNEKVLFSYYDTSLSKNAYKIVSAGIGAGFKLQLDKSEQNARFIELFANWLVNDYSIKLVDLDNDDKTSLNEFVNDLGSSSATGVGTTAVSGNTNATRYYYGENTLETFLLGQDPRRIGYDFIGWTFNYVPVTNSSLQSIAAGVNSPSSVLKLSDELFAQYLGFNGVDGTSSIESNVLMINNGRLSDYKNNKSTWILNKTGEAERLGDAEESSNRCIYIFALWKPQTFSINISLNISGRNLLNLHEKDSSFALALYNNAAHTSFVGIDSKNYTYNRTAASSPTSSNEYSLYQNYYNDIVANVCFEIEFDKRFDTATCVVAGNTYNLKDLFATSAGYYFVGLIYEKLASVENLSQYAIVRNTLANVLTLDGLEQDEDTIGGGVFYKQATDGQALVFDMSFYENLNTVNFATGTNYNQTAGNVISLTSTSLNGTAAAPAVSTNFGKFTIGGVNYPIMSEFESGQYYLFFIRKNVKYFVVPYIYQSGSPNYIDCISFDRTFMYYHPNGKDEGLAKYTIRYYMNGNDISSIKPYYVDNGFANKHDLTDLRFAVYTYRTNTLFTTQSGNDRILPSVIQNANGTLFYHNSGTNWKIKTADYNGDCTLTNAITRQFTLYAVWEKRKVTTTIVNGNHSGTTADNNPGLAGWFRIDTDENSTDINNATFNSGGRNAYSNLLEDEGISLKKDFYSNDHYTFLPWFNGRYMSEMAIEFDYLTESSNNDGTSNYVMMHANVTIKFSWDSSDKRLSIESVKFNGGLINNGVNNKIVNNPTGNNLINTHYFLNNISQLSLLDKYWIDKYSSSDSNINTSLNNIKSSLNIYEYDKMPNVTSVSLRNDNQYKNINGVTLDLINVMTDIQITCKFSVQTYKLEVYTVVQNDSISVEKTSFTDVNDYNTYINTGYLTKSALQNDSNYLTSNRATLGDPYISNQTYNAYGVATISTDCAKLPTTSYNIPYGYIVFDDVNLENIRQRLIDTSNSNGLGYEIYGFKYIYGSAEGAYPTYTGHYTRGSFDDTISRQYINGLGLLNQDSFFTANYDWWAWLDGDEDSMKTVGGYLVAKKYNETEPIFKNTVIYGYYSSVKKNTTVTFYYWDTNQNRYMPYTNNIDEYTWKNEGPQNSNVKMVNYSDNAVKLTAMPSPAIATWYGQSDEAYQFVGYVLINNSVKTGLAAIPANGDYNRAYNNTAYKKATSRQQTTMDIYSALAKLNPSLISPSSDAYSALQAYTITDIFSNRLVVYDKKYFVANGYLDGVRLVVPFKYGSNVEDTLDVYKDFEVLSVNTELTKSTSHIAIPIYEKLELNFAGCNVSGTIITLTPNSNMVDSAVFETTSSGTIAYLPSELWVVVSTKSNLTLNDINTNNVPITSGKTKFNKQIGEKLDINFADSTYFAQSTTYYVYGYYKSTNSQANSIAFKMTGIYFYVNSNSGLTIVPYKDGEAYTPTEAHPFSTDAKINPYVNPSKNGEGGVLNKTLLSSYIGADTNTLFDYDDLYSDVSTRTYENWNSHTITVESDDSNPFEVDYDNIASAPVHVETVADSVTDDFDALSGMFSSFLSALMNERQSYSASNPSLYGASSETANTPLFGVPILPDPDDELELESIAIGNSPRTNYTTSDTGFDLTDATIICTYYNSNTGGNEHETVAITNGMLSAFDNSVGTNTCTVTYLSKTTTFDYTVSDFIQYNVSAWNSTSSYYSNFYDKAINIYNNHVHYDFISDEHAGVSNSLSKTALAVFDSTSSYGFVFRNDEINYNVDIQTVISSLFGFNVISDFKTVVQKMLNTYYAYRSTLNNISFVKLGDKYWAKTIIYSGSGDLTYPALLNNCFYNSTMKYLVFPVAVHGNVGTVTSYIFIDINNKRLAIWINRIDTAEYITYDKYLGSAGPSTDITNTLYCKNALFDEGHNFQFNFTEDDVYASGTKYYVYVSSLIRELEAKGLTKSIICGLLANIYTESSFEITNITGPHYGLFQKKWTYDRFLWDYSKYTLVYHNQSSSYASDITNSYGISDAVKDLNWQLTYLFYAGNLGYGSYGDDYGFGNTNSNFYKTVFPNVMNDKTMDGKGKAMQIAVEVCRRLEIPYGGDTDDAVLNSRRAAKAAILYDAYNDLKANKKTVNNVTMKNGSTVAQNLDSINGKNFLTSACTHGDSPVKTDLVDLTIGEQSHKVKLGSDNSKDSRNGNIYQVGTTDDGDGIYVYAVVDYKPADADEEIEYEGVDELASPFDGYIALQNKNTSNQAWKSFYENALTIIAADSESEQKITVTGGASYSKGSVRALIVKIALQLLQANIILYGGSAHYYSLSFNSDKSGFREPWQEALGGEYYTDGQHYDGTGYYNLLDTINFIKDYLSDSISDTYTTYKYNTDETTNSVRWTKKQLRTDCFGFVRLCYCIAAYTICPSNPGGVFSWCYDYHGAYSHMNRTFDTLGLYNNTVYKAILPGDAIRCVTLHDGKAHHVAMYLGDSTYLYMDQNGGGNGMNSFGGLKTSSATLITNTTGDKYWAKDGKYYDFATTSLQNEYSLKYCIRNSSYVFDKFRPMF